MSLKTFGPVAGRRLLWLHGWLGHGSEGREVQKILGEEFCVVCPDLPGHGETPLGDWTLPGLLKEIAALAEKTDGAVGYSMGGRLLMMAAARYPQSFSSVVIESAHPGLISEVEKAERRRVDHQRARELTESGLSEFCATWYAASMWGGLTPPVRKGDSEELAGALERFGLGHQPDLHPWLRTTSLPLLWLAGSRDQGYINHTKWLRKHTSHRAVLVDCGHNVHAQCPDAWCETLKEFYPRT